MGDGASTLGNIVPVTKDYVDDDKEMVEGNDESHTTIAMLSFQMEPLPTGETEDTGGQLEHRHTCCNVMWYERRHYLAVTSFLQATLANSRHRTSECDSKQL